MPTLSENFNSILIKLIGKQSEVRGLLLRTRYLLIIDTLCVIAAYCLSLIVRYESLSLSVDILLTRWYWVLLSLALRLGLYRMFGLYARLWRYASVQEVMQIVKASALTSVVQIIINFVPLLFGFPFINALSIIFLDWLINLAFLSGSRLTLRMILNWLSIHNKRVLSKLSSKNYVLIAGAGDVGLMVAKMMFENPDLGYEPVGFIDDDKAKESYRVLGIPVLGGRRNLSDIIKQRNVKELVVAMPTAPQDTIDEIYNICQKIPIPMRVIPDIRGLLTGTLSVEQLRQWRSQSSYRDASIDINKTSHTIQNVMVTGGAGFIGSNFVRYMLSTYPSYRIVVYDKLTYAGNLDNLRGLKQIYGDRFVFIKGDICNAAQVSEAMRDCQIDTIVNFSAETHVDRSLMFPEDFLITNILGTFQLLEAAKQFNIVRYHQVSTDEVYGQVIRGSFNEEDPLETRSPYSASKASGDLLTHAYYVSFGVPATISRGSNNIGPYQYPEKAVPLFITNALENKLLPIYGDGLYIRDYQYVLDHCRGIDFVLHYGKIGEIYNLGGNNEVTALDLAKLILDRLGKPQALIRLVNDRSGQDRRYSLNCSKIRTLGWEPQWPFEKALDTTIDWYIHNEEWWRKLKTVEYREYYDKQYRERLEKAGQLTAMID